MDPGRGTVPLAVTLFLMRDRTRPWTLEVDTYITGSALYVVQDMANNMVNDAKAELERKWN